MTLEQLRIFVATAEREHVTRAAQALNLTQSAVSNAIAALEGRHGLRLFDRTGRGIALNATGRAFLVEARAVLARARQAEALLTDLAGLRRGRLSIAASQTVATYWLPTRLARFHAAHPAIELDVQAGNTRDVARAVHDGTAELGIVEGETDDPALDAQPVGQDRLVVLVPPDHSWVGRERLDPSELAAASWIMREPGSGTRASLEAALVAAGCVLEPGSVALTLPSNEAVLQAVLAGIGVAALSEHVAGLAFSAGLLAAAAFKLPMRHFTLLHHRERELTRAAASFAVMLSENAADCAG